MGTPFYILDGSQLTLKSYCRGEGAVTFILKRLEDAVADNDPVRGVILGAYTNHSAEADSITRPHVPAQKEIFTKILQDSGIHPVNVGYVEVLLHTCSRGSSFRADTVNFLPRCMALARKLETQAKCSPYSRLSLPWSLHGQDLRDSLYTLGRRRVTSDMARPLLGHQA